MKQIYTNYIMGDLDSWDLEKEVSQGEYYGICITSWFVVQIDEKLVYGIVMFCFI